MNFIQSPNPELLQEKTNAALRASRALLCNVLNTFPPEKLATLQDVLDTGGRVGLTLTIDGHGVEHVELVAVETEGVRRTLATIGAPIQ